MNAQRFIPLIDLTRLNDDDHADAVREFCKTAVTPYGSVAALCVYPAFVSIAAETRANPQIKIATVINFPDGNQSIDTCVQQIQQASADGADEMDVVLPYTQFLQGEKQAVHDFVTAIRDACQAHTLKIIVESGAFPSTETLLEACELCVACQVDFIKTSTGKIKIGATPEAVATILHVLQQHPQIGLKISGGVRTIAQAKSYYEQVQKTMGDAWINPQHLRFGASQLLQGIVETCKKRGAL